MKHKYRIKVVTTYNEPTLYYPQVKKWYGWCYFYNTLFSNIHNTIQEKVFYYELPLAILHLKQKKKQKTTITYITPEL